MESQYLQKVQEYFGTDGVFIEETFFGAVAIKGNREISGLFTVEGIDHSGGNLRLSLGVRGRTLHERVLLLKREIPIRSHQESYGDLIKNIGGTKIRYREPLLDRTFPITLIPGEVCHAFDPATDTIDGHQIGFSHGFDTVDGPGLLYVAKVLRQEYVRNNSFHLPENTYRF